MPLPAIQDFYPDDFSHCYGCGRLNANGLHLRSSWDGDDMVARYTPRGDEIAMPGFVYGGLIASLIDCHAMGTAAAAVERAVGWHIGDRPAERFVTGALKIDFLKPTPIGYELEVRARAREIGERKVIVDATLSANGVVTARGEIVAVRLPETMKATPELMRPTPETTQLTAEAMRPTPETMRPTPKATPLGVDVFFYGLFMDVESLLAKGLHPSHARLASVDELGLRIGKRAALVPETGGRVYGVVVKMPRAELNELYGDPTVQEYQPVDVMARLADGSTVTALCYNLPTPPSDDERNPEYVAKLKALAGRIGLPPEYVASIG
jgi:acyl-coenzyme A thioesterase PaaI-like protein